MVEGDITNLDSLYPITIIEGNLTIGSYFNDGNIALINLSGLDNVTTIGGNLEVGSNYALTSLSALQNVISIGGELVIYFNDALTSLDGLFNLDYTTIDTLFISENSNLSVCDIQPICDYLENGGYAEIHDNAPGCNTQQEVEEACQAVSVNDLINGENIQLFPNPTTGIIQLTTPDNTEWKVCVRDAMGRIIIQPHQLVNGEIDLSTVPIGLYFLELNDGQHSITKRIIKQ